MWSDQLGMEETEKLLDALREIRPVSIRLSGRLSDEERDRLLEQLRSRRRHSRCREMAFRLQVSPQDIGPSKASGLFRGPVDRPG